MRITASKDSPVDKIIGFIFEQLSTEGKAAINSESDFEPITEKLNNWIKLQRAYERKLDELCDAGEPFAPGLRDNGFALIKKYFQRYGEARPSNFFNVKNKIRCLIKGHTFDNFMLDQQLVYEALLPLQAFNQKLDLFNNDAFSYATVQLTSSMKDPDGSWELSTLDFHIDVPYPNLKAFIAGNIHSESTGNYCVYDIAKVDPNLFFYQTLATGISSSVFQSLPFNNTLTEKYGLSKLRHLFNNEFCEWLIQPYSSESQVDFYLEPGDLVISNNMVPHVRKLGAPGWVNRRIFIHPSPYAR